MGWIYDAHRKIVSDLVTDIAFSVTLSGEGSNEIGLTLLRGSDSNWSEKERVDNHKAIVQAVSDELVRLKMERLLASPHLYRSKRTAARVLEQRTGKSVTPKAIQTWIAEPSRRSSRRCPNWALKALQEYIGEEEQKGAKPSTQMPLTPWSAEVLDKKVVEFAEAAIRDDERKRAEWMTVSVQDLPDRIWKLEKELKVWMYHHDNLIHAITRALTQAKDLEEAKKLFIEARDEKALIDHGIRETRADLEAGRAEFAPPEQGTHSDQPRFTARR